MHIGIDCREILDPAKGQGAGVGVYVYELVANLISLNTKDQFTLFIYEDYVIPEKLQAGNVSWIKLPRRQSNFLVNHCQLSKLINNSGIDLLHAPANTFPLFVKVPVILTVHDLAIYVNPDWFPKGQPFATKYFVPRSIKKAQRIIAVSQATKKDIIKFFNKPTDQIEVIYEGIRSMSTSDPRILKRLRLERGKYFAFVSTLEPRKNIKRLIKAFAATKLSAAGYKLILAGKIPESFDKSLVADDASVLIPGYITDAERVALIQNATAFTYPSLYEGFGLPVVEAIAMGVPVITSNISSMPEVGGEGVTYVDPYDIDDITAVLRQAVDSEEVITAEFKDLTVNKFLWTKAAENTYGVYRQLHENND